MLERCQRGRPAAGAAVLGSMGSPDFRRAIREYRMLLGLGYPKHSLLALVGNRHRLTREERTAMARGVASPRTGRARRRKRTRRIRGATVHVDGYNVLFTVASYLQGKLLFVADDGFLRDAAEDHGKSHGGEMVEKAASLVVACAAASGVARLRVLLDAPVSHSARTAESIRRAMESAGLPGQALLSASPDHDLKGVRDGVVATSDSAVIDGCSVRVVDLARLTLESRYRPRFLRLG